VLAFRRGDLLCITNFAGQASPLPAGELLLASDDLTPTGELPPDSTAWLLEAITERKA
jgi:alpha-glucosidase